VGYLEEFNSGHLFENIFKISGPLGSNMTSGPDFINQRGPKLMPKCQVCARISIMTSKILVNSSIKVGCINNVHSQLRDSEPPLSSNRFNWISAEN
jgi:hypothetical protein